MHRRCIALGAAGFAALGAGIAIAEPSTDGFVLPTTRFDRGPDARALARLPLAFETNRGQAPAGWDFLVRCRGYHAFVNSTGVVFSFDGAKLSMTLEGAARVEPTTAGRGLAGRVNYFLGDDPSRWITEVPLVRGAGYADVAPATGWSVGGRGRALEFAFDLAPAAAAPRLRFDGARRIEVAADGSLKVAMPSGEATISAPVAWQEIGGLRVDARARFVAGPDGAVRVETSARDPDHAVLVDPTVTYESYLAGAKADACNGVAMDSSNHAYYAGSTMSADFPKTAGAYDTALGGTGTTTDAFVTKLNPDGATLAYSTFLGGTLNDQAYALVVDAAGGVCLVGQAGSNFPLTSSSETNNSSASFLAVLNPGGASLALSTYTRLVVRPGTIAFGPPGSVYFLEDVGLARYSATTTYNPIWNRRIEPSTGSGTMTLTGVASDSNGDAYVVGHTDKTTYVGTTGAYQTTIAGQRDAFVTKVDSTGAVVYASLLGGSAVDQAYGVDVNAAGQAYVVGATLSSNFPLTADAYRQSLAQSGQTDAFIARFDAVGEGLRYASYLGGGEARAVRIHSGASCVVAGRTTTFPTTDAFQNSPGGGFDGFVLKLHRDNTLAWSSYCGGGADDAVNAVGMGPDGTIAFGGATNSTNFPLSAAIYGQGGLGDAFMVVVPDTLPVITPVSVSTTLLPDWTVGFPYVAPDLAPSGGVGPYAWSVASGTLPPGLDVSATGDVTGTPTQAGTFPFVVRVVDAAETHYDRQLIVQIVLPPSLASPTMPEATVDTPYDKLVVIANGTGSKSFVVTAGAPPPGLELSADGRLLGTPTEVGGGTFTVFVTDAFGATCSGAVTVLVNALPAIATAAVPPWTQGRPYSVQFATSGGTPDFKWIATGGALPTPTPIDAATGLLSGVAGAARRYSFTMNAIDANGAIASKAFVVDINPPPTVDGRPLPPAAVGRPYSVQIPRTGGTPPFAWTLGAGIPIDRLAIGAVDGVLSGVPTTAQSGATSAVSYVCTDAAGATAGIDVALLVAVPVDLSKRRSSEKIAFAAGAELTVSRFLELPEGALLTVQTTGGNNGNGPAIVLVDAAGVALDLSEHVKSTAKSSRLSKFPIPATGRYFLTATPAAGFIGKASLVVAVTPKSTWTGGAEVGPASNAEFTFAATPGARVAITARSSKASAALPRIVSVLAPDGTDLVPGGRLVERGRTAVFTSKAQLAGGAHTVKFAARDANAGAVAWTVRLSAPRTYAFALPGVAAGD